MERTKKRLALHSNMHTSLVSHKTLTTQWMSGFHSHYIEHTLLMGHKYLIECSTYSDSMRFLTEISIPLTKSGVTHMTWRI